MWLNWTFQSTTIEQHCTKSNLSAVDSIGTFCNISNREISSSSECIKYIKRRQCKQLPPGSRTALVWSELSWIEYAHLIVIDTGVGMGFNPKPKTCFIRLSNGTIMLSANNLNFRLPLEPCLARFVEWLWGYWWATKARLWGWWNSWIKIWLAMLNLNGRHSHYEHV